MPIGVLPGGMTLDFADAVFIINAPLALMILFGVLYIEEILAAASRLLRALNPLTMPARFRMWRAAHKTPG